MHLYNLTIITENQKQRSKAEKLAVIIKQILPVEDVEIEPYTKFENSFKLIFNLHFKEEISIGMAVEMTDRLCSPWIITYDREIDEAELMFVKNDHSRFRLQNFNVIQWAYFEKCQNNL